MSCKAGAAGLAGCKAREVPEGAWTPSALSAEQADLVATIAEHILPETDTPGARAVGVHRFIDAMLADSFPDEERQHFLAGLSDVDARAQRSCGRAFLRCATLEQRAVLDQLDREAFAATASLPDRLPETPGSRPGSDTDPGRKFGVPFFRTMKELTLVGYYTSEAGATRELRHAPVPGRFEGCVPLDQIGRAWAV